MSNCGEFFRRYDGFFRCRGWWFLCGSQVGVRHNTPIWRGRDGIDFEGRLSRGGRGCFCGFGDGGAWFGDKC